jgi:Flp pilus assembly protein TadG
MTTRDIDGRPRPHRRGRGDKGAAMVEFAFVSILLFTLVFGIINFGMLMSFRGSMQQAASEGARAAAVAPRAILTSATGQRDNTVAVARATVARDLGLKGYGKTCGTGGTTCTTTVFDCASTTGADTVALPDCITVKVVYDNRANPYPTNLPIVSKLTPPTITVSSTEQLNDR